MDSIIEAVRDHWITGLITGALTAFAKFYRRGVPGQKKIGKFRSLMLYLTAVKEYETAIATALYWSTKAEERQKEIDQERASGLRWKMLYDECMTTCSKTGSMEARMSAQAEESRE